MRKTKWLCLATSVVSASYTSGLSLFPALVTGGAALLSGTIGEIVLGASAKRIADDLYPHSTKEPYDRMEAQYNAVRYGSLLGLVPFALAGHMACVSAFNDAGEYKSPTQVETQQEHVVNTQKNYQRDANSHYVLRAQ
ncbi:MAG: hypothetical protein VYC19_03745 [Pseudomonadota bacterium]|jgi:hypothetical protein|nr:hypothetical protein [Pseudomonadota bacterium]MEE3322343.1 hypothetical protein [Pseudomonadota bacterium]